MAIDPLPAPVYAPPSTPGVAAGIRATAGVEPPSEAASTPAHDPPERALEAVQVAAEAYEQMRRTGRELHFELEEGVLRIQVYDGTGELVASIPPNEALAIASREASWQA